MRPGPGLGVALSHDAGRTWATATRDTGHAFFGRILVDPEDPAHLVAADVQVGVVESRDQGRSWTPLGSAAAAWVSSADGLKTIFASGGPTPQRSADGGSTWTALDVPVGVTLVEAAPDGTLYAGAHDGFSVVVWISRDDGGSWARP